MATVSIVSLGLNVNFKSCILLLKELLINHNRMIPDIKDINIAIHALIAE